MTDVTLTDTCPECCHIITPEGCTGPPTPSDVWAGVTPATCDCPCPLPMAGETVHHEDQCGYGCTGPHWLPPTQGGSR